MSKWDERHGGPSSIKFFVILVACIAAGTFLGQKAIDFNKEYTRKQERAVRNHTNCLLFPDYYINGIMGIDKYKGIPCKKILSNEWYSWAKEMQVSQAKSQNK